jgi:uncharacterized protein YndB with AHSA1/START domain
MARNERFIPVSPDVVFSVLNDPPRYAYFVVGARKIRRFDPNWPEVGSAFHHTQGAAAGGVRDCTTVVSAEPPHRLRLHAGLGPLAVNVVDFELAPEGEGTRLVIEEYPIEGPAARIWSPPLEAMMRARNAIVLRRIEWLACGLAEQRRQQTAADARAAGAAAPGRRGADAPGPPETAPGLSGTDPSRAAEAKIFLPGTDPGPGPETAAGVEDPAGR